MGFNTAGTAEIRSQRELRGLSFVKNFYYGWNEIDGMGC